MQKSHNHNYEPSPHLLELLVCPLTKTELYYDKQKKQLVSHAAGLAFSIVNGVPIMLIEEAETLNK